MNKKYCILAGGCFWCIARPFYELNGVLTVLSGYSGGTKIDPTYEEVKSQTTGHYEVIKIVYDSDIIGYEEILKVYLENIDPFDDGGQFIDRGSSYQLAVFYQDEIMKNTAENVIKNMFNKPTAIKLFQEKEFYLAEEFHQDYAIKNPEEIEKEFIISGRNNKK
jgi:peptide-methionine (S)-S-oxide reductase